MVLALISALALCAALFIPVSKTVSVDGTLRPEGGSFQLQAGRQGTIVRQLASVGDQVSAGQALLLISAEPGSGPHGESLGTISDSMLRRLASLKEEESSQEQVDELEHLRLAQRLRARQQEHEVLARSIIEAQARIAIREASLQRYVGLEGFFPQGQIDQQRDALLQQQQTLNELRRQQLFATAETEELSNDLRRKPLESQQRAAARAREVIKLGEEIAEAEMRRSVFVRAPIDGVLASMPLDAGKSVNAQDVVVTVIPRTSELIAEFEVPDRAMAANLVHARMSLRLASFPYERYGQLGALVVNLSRESQAAGALRGFVGRARLDRQHIFVDGNPTALLSGMRFSGSVQTDSRRLWQWIVEPLLRDAGSS